MWPKLVTNGGIPDCEQIVFLKEGQRFCTMQGNQYRCEKALDV